MISKFINLSESRSFSIGLKLTCIIAVIELIIMQAFHFLRLDKWISPLLIGLLDALLLGLLSAISIFLLVFRPMKTLEEFKNVETARRKIEDELIERVRQTTLGAEIGTILVQQNDLRSLLQFCAEAIVKHLDAAFTRIWVLNESTNLLELKASAGMYTRITGKHAIKEIGKLKIGIIAQEKKPLLTNSVLGDPMIIDQEWVKREGIMAFAGHPLVVDDKLVGVMGLFSKKSLLPATLEALASISDEISLGIIRKKTDDRIHFLAYYDNLTSLPNRYFFTELVKRSIEYAKRYKHSFAIALIDIDDFKLINDTFGHPFGDELLKMISARLSKTLRSSDYLARIYEDEELLVRMGGDEFIVLLHENGEPGKASLFAQRILSDFSNPYNLNGHKVFLTVSIGLTLFPNDGTDMDNLLKNVDTALYHAKKMGKNNFQFYTKSMNEAVVELMTMENNLRRAIENKEFSLYYQPKVDILTNEIVGMEALIRWQTPEGSFIPPAKFIPLAETIGLINRISGFVLKTACQQNKIWQDAGLSKVSVAVNVSGLEFGQKSFVENVLETLEKSGLDPQYLELEITETMIMKNPAMAIDNLKRIKKSGIRIALDDFGTGYSSLSYLQRLPLDALKIDISFIRNVTTDPNNALIVKTIIAMAHTLNLKVIAEGVEDNHQLEHLRKDGCDIMQGYLYSPPIPPQDFEKLFKL